MNTSHKAKKNPHHGSSFEGFLKEEGVFEVVQAAAVKRAVALKIRDLMDRSNLSKTDLAKRMHTSRAALHRLLDPENESVTLATISKAAKALGRTLKIEFVPA